MNGKVIFAAAFMAGASAQRCMDKGFRDESWVYSKPTKGDSNYGPYCGAWAGSTCCTTTYTDLLKDSGVGAIYPGFDWNHCGARVGRNMSSQCLQFFLWEECFYACDPWAATYEDPQNPAVLKRLPICGTMCDDWYEACKNEYTCVKDWLAFPFDETNGTYYCQESCQTFEQTYGSSQEMCNTMWGDSFFYSTNMDQCYSFYFWGSHNPNKYAAVGTTGNGAAAVGAGAGAAAAAAVVAAAAAALVGLAN